MMFAAAIRAAHKTDLSNAELQRAWVEAQLRNLIDDVPEDFRPRFDRLLRSLEDVATASSARKVEVLRDMVAPALEHMS